MNRDRWLIPIAILLFFSAAVYSFAPRLSALLSGKKTATVASPSAPQPGAHETVVRNFVKMDAGKKEIGQNTPWGRNPFLTEEETKGEERVRDDLQVKAIIIGKPKSVAMVDGYTVVVGEKIGEETVSEILPDAVVLEKEGRKRILRTGEPVISIEIKEVKNEEQ